MQVPFTVVFEPPSRADVRALARSWRFWARLGFVLMVIGITVTPIFLAYHVVRLRQIEVATATITVASSPGGAAVDVDGSPRGQTPLTIPVIPGAHQVALHLNGYAGSASRVTVENGQTVNVQSTLWLAQPRLQQIRPPVPGAAIANAQFLDDGQVALTVGLPPSAERQLWLVDGGAPRRIGPVGVMGPLAVSSNGQRVAYTISRSGSALGNSPTELWLAGADGKAGHQIYTAASSPQPEQVTDLSWSPDGGHLLVASERQLPDGGGLRTRLLWVSLDGGDPRELAVLPSQVVAGSYNWGPQGHVAFLVKSGAVTSLCLIDTGSGALQYVADLSRDNANPTLFAPVAWTADGGRVTYSAPVVAPSNQLDRLLGGQLYSSLFTTAPSGIGSQRVSVLEGQSPVWRSDGSLVMLSRPKKGSGVIVRVLSSSGPYQDLVTLPLAGQVIGVRWDVSRGQALMALRDSSQLGDSQATYWLVKFTPGVAL